MVNPVAPGPSPSVQGFLSFPAMDHSLAELLIRHTRLESLLRSLGISTVCDVCFFWRDAHDCLCELERVTDILSMQDLYQICVARADLERGASARSIVAARDSSFRGAVLWKPARAESAVKKPRT